MNRVISSSLFTWVGRSGCLSITDVKMDFNPFNGQPVTVVSSKTGVAKVFEVDDTIPGHEDGWDGEACYYVSDDGVKISFFND